MVEPCPCAASGLDQTKTAGLAGMIAVANSAVEIAIEKAAA